MYQHYQNVVMDGLSWLLAVLPQLYFTTSGPQIIKHLIINLTDNNTLHSLYYSNRTYTQTL